ncbi:hypothetical protein [Paenibacillus cineris]|nr:hypothetical protein [Paenibacillus cineris]GIO60276.1 hypothetical protein J43TS9_18500 [Paenibacillus cineris]
MTAADACIWSMNLGLVQTQLRDCSWEERRREGAFGVSVTTFLTNW